MKVLFAVSNESISESIIKKYQQEYREIIASKNVYYFNAIAKELQKDKSYDRIVISEDLEPYANNNYEIIDKFIFEKLDNISDEANSNNGQDIPVILICADRRNKSESFLVKIFGIGIYSALLGSDRSITNVCELINKPRNKKDAKIYYRIDSDDIDYKSEGDASVSEIEIQNILNHYKRLGKNEEQYVVSFDSIATQYTDAQLKVICRFLPISVRAVLEANSQKYQELITFGTVTPNSAERRKHKAEKYVPNKEYQEAQNNKAKQARNIDILEKNIGKANLTKPVVIPSSRKISEVKKVNAEEQVVNIKATPKIETVNNVQENAVQNHSGLDDIFEDILPNTMNSSNINEQGIEEAPKKRRGRPKKVQSQEVVVEEIIQEEAPKKRRGRPKKVQPQEELVENIEEESDVLPGFDNFDEDTDEYIEPEQQEAVNLFDLGDEQEEEIVAPEPMGGIILPGFDDEDEEEIVQEEPEYPSNYVVESDKEEKDLQYNNQYSAGPNRQYNQSRELENTVQYQDINLDSLLTRDKKVVAFVGTSKNGTSFLINNLAEILSNKGIKTAILDLTKNKNSYYIYTKNEEDLRKRAFTCIDDLQKGNARGIIVNKNLTVYTTVPDEYDNTENYNKILTTLAQNYSLVLMDCDFNTNYGYLKNAQEIYLVQSFDILTIQPLTAYLRDLKAKNVLNPEKLRIVLNKALKVRSVTEKTIVGGMAFYNDPAMSFMTELFNKDTIKYCSIPFEEQTYSRYLEGLVNCEITTKGYSKTVLMYLDKLANMVYPLLSNNDKNVGRLNSYSSNSFSNNMNNTLNKMKNSY